MKSFLVLCFLAMVASGCATRKAMPEPSFLLTNSESLVFGRIEIEVDGQLTQPFGPSFDRSAGWHFSPFTSVRAVEKNEFEPGKYMLLIDREDGYFATAIPPGDYYFVELFAAKFAPGTRTLGARSYTGRCVPPLSAIRHAVVLIFHAKPGVATYIGTIRLWVSTNSEFICMITGGDSVRYERLKGTVVDGWRIINDTESAVNVFHDLFPNVPTLDAGLVRIESLNPKPLMR